MSAATQVPATRVVNPLAPVGNQGTLKNMLEAMKAQIAQILPQHVKAERIIKSALVAVNRQPQLLECTQLSVMKAIMEASELGLDPSGGTLGQGYLVPFNNKIKGTDGREVWAKQATFIPGYRGLCDLARRGGDVKLIEAHVVYKGDEFQFELGTARKLRHIRGDHDELDKDISHAYAIAWLSDDEFQFEVMTRRQLEKVRGISKAKDRGPWVDHFSEMCRKTVIRRLVKYLPISSERLARAIDTGDANEFGMSAGGSIIDAAQVSSSPSAPKNAGDGIADRIIAGPEASGQTVDPSDASDPAPVENTVAGPEGAEGDAGDEPGTHEDPPADVIPDFTDWASFDNWMNEAAQDQEISSDTAAAAIGKLRLGDCNAPRLNKRLAAQKAVAATVLARTFVWKADEKL